jgi:3-methyladenine DNA glycosylase AlkD
MSVEAEIWLGALRQRLAAEADADAAAAMEAYMKHKVYFYGIKAGPRRELLKEHLSVHGIPRPFDPTLFRALWADPHREMQHCGLDIMRKHAKKIGQGDIVLIEELIRTKSWWDTVDGLASWVCGPYFLLYPDQRDVVLDRWAVSDDMWLRRSAIIHQISYKKKTDTARLFRYITLNLGSKEFFINKAIGWALRSYADVAPSEVIRFVENHSLSGLSRREALRKL